MADLLRAVASLSGVAALFWPVVAITGVLVLRPHLPALMAGLKSIRMGPFAAEWVQREERAAEAIVRASAPADASADLIGMANTSPLQAVHKAFDQLVGDLRAISEEVGLPAHGERIGQVPPSDPVYLAGLLGDLGAIDPGLPAQLETLRDLVSLATFEHGRLESAEALRFVTYAQVARDALRRSRKPGFELRAAPRSRPGPGHGRRMPEVA